MRIKGNAEDFVRQDGDGYSKRDRFGFSLKRKLNATHFDIFTVLPSSDGQFTGKIITLHFLSRHQTIHCMTFTIEFNVYIITLIKL